MAEPERFCLVQDDDTHWYIIPVEREEEFDAILDTDPDSIEALDFAKRISNPSNITFSDWKDRT